MSPREGNAMWASVQGMSIYLAMWARVPTMNVMNSAANDNNTSKPTARERTSAMASRLGC